MAAPTITRRPNQISTGTTLSDWVACGGKLPVVYEITNTKFPTNSEDSTDSVTAVADNGGLAQLTIASHTYSAGDYLQLTNFTPEDNYNGVFLVVSDDGINTLTIDTPFTANDTGNAQKYYFNYALEVDIYAGIDSGHPHTSEDPISLIATIKQLPESDNTALVDVSQYVKTKLQSIYDDGQTSWPNDLNAWKDFYIVIREVSQNTTLETVDDSSNVYHATYSALQFGSVNGGNMQEYVVDTGSSEIKFLTNFERLEYFLGGGDLDISIISNIDTFDLYIEQYGQNDVLLTSDEIIYSGDGYGVYRLLVSDIDFEQDTIYFLVSVEDAYNTLTEIKRVNYNTTLCVDVTEAPTNLTASLTGINDALLQWSDNSINEQSFEIFRSLTSGSGFAKIGEVGENINTFIDTGLTSETTYYYKVRAIGKDGTKSAFTNEASITTGFVLTLTTNISPTVLNPFNPSINYSSADTPRWIFENGFEITGNSVNDTDGSNTGLDGTSQDVLLIIVDKTAITELVSQSDSLTGSYNFSSLSGLESLFFRQSTGITAITLPSNTFTNIVVDNNALSSLDLSNVDFNTNSRLEFFSNTSLSSLTLSSGNYSGSMLTIYGQGCALSGTFNANKFTSATNFELNLDSNASLTGINFGSNLTTCLRIQIGDCNLSSIDFTNVEFVSNGIIRIEDNFNLSTFTQLASGHAGDIVEFDIRRNGISGNLDVSDIDFANNFIFQCGNPSAATGNITSVTFPAGFSFPTNCGTLRFNDNNISSLDISWANFNVRSRLTLSNVPLNTLTLPGSMSSAFSSIDITGTNLVSIDLSWIVLDANQNPSGDNGSFNLFDNTSLTTITLPSSTSVPFQAIRMNNNDWNYSSGQLNIAGIFDINDQETQLQNNSWTVSEVNQVLVDIDSSASGGFTGRSINISGTNAAPDSSSGGNNGTAAVASLQGKGFTVTTS